MKSVARHVLPHGEHSWKSMPGPALISFGTYDFSRDVMGRFWSTSWVSNFKTIPHWKNLPTKSTSWHDLYQIKWIRPPKRCITCAVASVQDDTQYRPTLLFCRKRVARLPPSRSSPKNIGFSVATQSQPLERLRQKLYRVTLPWMQTTCQVLSNADPVSEEI